MDESDLRAGNVVSLENNIYIIDSVCGVNCSLYRPIDDYDDEYREWSCEGLTPVTIDESILEWLEFSENKRCWGSMFEKTVGTYYVTLANDSNKEGCDWSVHIDNSRFEYIGGANIQYVHELQNIIRLCTGCDLEVKLSKLAKNS